MYICGSDWIILLSVRPIVHRLKLYYKVDSVGYLPLPRAWCLTLICEGYLCPGRRINVES